MAVSRVRIGLPCPECFEDRSKVTDSRGDTETGNIRRRRECLSCGTRFSTEESIIEGTVKPK